MIIFADDVGTGDVPGYWDNGGKVNMPNLEHLVRTGTTFTDAHSTPLCATSRYTLLSGNYQHRGTNFAGTWKINYRGSQFRNGQQSIAQVFRDNGYHTSMFGKWHLGGQIPRTKDFILAGGEAEYEITSRSPLSEVGHEWNRQLQQGPWHIGFQESYITTGGIQAPPYAFLRNGKFQSKDLNNIRYWGEGKYSMSQGFSSIIKGGEGAADWDSSAYNMILVNETEDFLNRHLEQNADTPFFTYVALGGVHVPHSPPDFYLDGEKIAGEQPTAHMDVLKEMDKVVGSMIQILEDKELIKDTIIVFASDNGGLGGKNGSRDAEHYSSGPLRAAKGSIYEGGHRIPMTLRWDNGMIPKGETRPQIVGLNDLYATLCDLVNIPVPLGQASDSVSFADYTLDESKKEGLREYLGVWSFSKKQDKLKKSSIRKKNMKLVYDHKTKRIQLYDLSLDIGEKNDIAEVPAYARLAREMYQKLREIGPCYDEEGRFDVYARSMKKLNKRSCKWFSKRKEKRCRRYHEGRTHCGWVCAEEKKSVCLDIYPDLR